MSTPRFVSVTALAVGWLSSLACGGGGSSASLPAKNLCAYAQTERECPCEAYGAGDAVTIDGMEVDVVAVRRWAGSAALPDIQNMDERSTFDKVGNNALALDVAFTNTKPVKHDVSLSFVLLTGDGEEHFVAPYNSRRYMKGKDGWLNLWEETGVGPGRSKTTGMVFPVAKGEEEGALLWIRKTEKKPDPMDPRGRLKTFTVEQVVLDLPPLE